MTAPGRRGAATVPPGDAVRRHRPMRAFVLAALVAVGSLAAIVIIGNVLPDVFVDSPAAALYWALYPVMLLASLVAAAELGRRHSRAPRLAVATGIAWWLCGAAMIGTALGWVMSGPLYVSATVVFWAAMVLACVLTVRLGEAGRERTTS